MAKRSAQSPDQPDPVNAGVGGDLKSPYQVYPKGEPQHDDTKHHTGLNGDQFEPLVPV